jgi:hypothetical protein
MADTPAGVATGRSSRTYYSSTGDRDAPSWNEVALVAGSESFETGKEGTIVGETRHSGRKYQESGGQDGAALKFTYQRPRGIDDAVYTALLASYIAGGSVYEWAVADGDITLDGTVGWQFFGKVTSLTWKRDLDKFVEYDVTIEERVHYEGTPAANCELISFEIGA